MPGWISRDTPSRLSEHEISPVRYFIAVIAALLVTETVVMVAIHWFLPPQPLMIEALLDSFMLAFVLFPFLYVFVLSPLLHIITEQKLTEQRLRASEQEWEGTFNTISSAITIHDLSLNIVKCNRKAEQLLGLTGQSGEGSKCHTYFHGTDVPPENCASCRALKEGIEVTAEFFEPYLNAYLEVRAIPKFDSNNRVEGLIHVVRDITRRKHTELELYESSQKLKILFQAAPVAIFVLDRAANVMMWNVAAERIFGWTEEEIIGKPYPLMPPDAGEEFAASFKKLMAGETLPALEVQRLRKNGSLVDVSLYLSPLFNAKDEAYATLGIAMDISSRKEAEAALVETKERYRRLVDYSPYGIAIHDGERFLFLNGACAAMLGAETPDDLVGRPVMDFVHPDAREEGQKYIEEIVSQGRIFPRLEMKVVRMDRKVVDVEMAAIPFTLENKMAVHLIATDVSDRKLAEEQLRVSLLEKDVLVKELHHRVKNNLQVVYSLLGLQSRYLQDERDIEIFNESQNRIRTMALIHEELCRSDNLIQIDFAAYIKRLSAHLFESYGANQHAVALQITADNVMIDIDTAVPCGLIINELVSNSLKYAFPDGKHDAGKVSVNLSEEFDRLVLRVSDNGIGLPKGLDFSNAATLGLRLVKILANQIGAAIDIRREMGTQFIISFNPPGTGNRP